MGSDTTPGPETSEPEGLPETLPGLLVRNRRERGDVRMLVAESVSITHAELDDWSRTVAARLVAAGCDRSARVGLLAPNGIDWVVTAAAVMRIGAVLVPLSTLLRPPELLEQIRTADVTHLIVARELRGRRYFEELEEAAPDLLAATEVGGRSAAAPSVRAVWSIDDLPADAVPGEFVVALEAAVRPADDLCVLFTSGSRGAPKGIIHTHGGAIRATAAGLETRCMHPDEVLYTPMPFFWMGGFGGGLIGTLVAGATLLTEATPEPARTLALLEHEHATLFRGWPDQAVRLAAHPTFATTDLSSLRDGSLPALLPPERRPSPGARANLFGMTESFGPWCGDRMDRDLPLAAQGSCGRPLDGVEVQIVDPETRGPAAAGESGEIWLRGSNLMRGICGRPRSEVFTADGWFPTGDLGRLDPGGYLWYSGRLDDMVKVKGATVYPSEVEAALRDVAEVRAAYVTDVAAPGDPVRREMAALVVTDATVDEVAASVRRRLSAFKVPTRWIATSDAGAVPLLASGKVDTTALRELLATQGM